MVVIDRLKVLVYFPVLNSLATYLSLLRSEILEGKMMYCTRQGDSTPVFSSRIFTSMTRFTMPPSL